MYGYNSGGVLDFSNGNIFNGNHYDAFSFNNKTATTDKKRDKAGCQGHVGDPVEVDDGAKLLSFPLFALPGEMGLKYTLYYHSETGSGVDNYEPWLSSIDYLLDTDCGFTNPNISCNQVTLYRPDGSSVSFSGNHAIYGNFPEIGGSGLATLVHNSNGTWTLHDEDTTLQIYNSAGQLISIKDVSGIGWTISSTVTTTALPDSAPPVHPCSVPAGYVQPMCIDPNPPPPDNGTTITTVVTHTDGQSYTIVSHTSYNTTWAAMNVTVTDPAGNQYAYEETGYPNNSGIWVFGLTSLTLPGTPTTTISFHGSAQLLTEVDFNGTAYWTTSYDSSNRVSADGAADGTERTSIVYSTTSGGLVATITNPLSLTTTNTYTTDSQGNYLLAKVSNSAVQGCGATTNSLAWDANDNLTKTVDNDSITHTYHYAANGQLQSETEAYGSATARTTNYVWDPNAQLNRLLSATIPGESKVSYTYNSQNRLASVTRTNLTGVGTANQSLTTTYAYTLYSDGIVEKLVVTQPSPSGTDHTTYAYDAHGNVTSVTDGLGHATTYSNYNALGQVGKVVGPNGDETDYTYDARGLVATKTTHPNGGTATWSYVYDGFGLLAKVTAPDGEVTTWSRDAEKRVKTISHNDKDGTSTEVFTYDANGDITSDVIARGSDIGKSTTYVYNALGKVYQVKGSHGQVLTYSYDGNGNVLSVTDALGHKTSYAYDALNRLVSVTNAAGGITSYAYDAGDHVIGVEDPRGLVTSYAWDGLGQLWQQVSPDTGTTNFVYDVDGRLASKTRADGTLITYRDDALNRVINIYADGQTRTYTWDSCTNGKGRLCSALTGVDSVDYSYTPEGWITARAFSFTNGPIYDVGYGYNAMGQVSEIVYPDGNEALYYYTDGVVRGMQFDVEGTTLNLVGDMTYRPMDLAMSGWNSRSGLRNTIGYDSDLRPTSITVPGVESLAFSYDAANRITRISNGLDSSMTQSFGYDALNRLISVSSGADNESYSYDADGNRINAAINGATWTYTVSGTSNRLVHAANGSWSGPYQYDANGNTLGTSHQYWKYGPFNRLQTVTPMSGSPVTTYDIDAEGQRLRKRIPTSNHYFAPGANGELLAEGQTGVPWSDYVWLNGRLVAIVKSGGIYAVHTDQTGRPAAITDASDDILWRANNWVFDRTVITDTWGDFNLGFPGQYNDTEVGDYWYNGYRDYSAQLGRYLESDPIGLKAGINTYAYVGNNPISNVDPLGLCDDHKCNKLERGAAIGAIDASNFADTSGTDAKYLGGAAAGGAVVGAVTADPVMVGAAGAGALAAAGVGTVSEATSVASGLLNTVASGGNFRYLGRAVLTSLVGGMTGELIGAIPVIGPGLSTSASSHLGSHLGSLQPLPPPCDVQ